MELDYLLNNGRLKKIDPGKLIDIKNPSDLDDFFLTLALVYNDLKSAHFFIVFLDHNKPSKAELDVYTGEFGGLFTFVKKYLTSIVSEFFELIRQNRDIIESPEFNNILYSIKRNYSEKWEDMIDIANNDFQKTRSNEFKRTLAKIRSNVSFHYYQSGKSLRSSYIKFFFQKQKTWLNESACYTLDPSMKDTRFFYADAAVEQNMSDAFSLKDSKKLRKILEEMHDAIVFIMEEYLNRK